MLGERWIVDRVPTERFPNYTRGNAGDVMADPVSPLGPVWFQLRGFSLAVQPFPVLSITRRLPLFFW